MEVKRPIHAGQVAVPQHLPDLASRTRLLAVEHLMDAFEEACHAGLSAIDAIHVVVAAQSGCEEFVTTEKPAQAIHRTSLLRIVSIDTDA